jgi:vacuolar-type H+-ATPase subunit E/Vma4
VGYQELLQALEEEVGRQIRELQTQASQERQRLFEAAGLELAARREAVLEQEGRRLNEESARALARARLEQERAILGEMRLRMDELRRAAEARLAAMNDPELLARLLEELVPELGEGPVALRVAEGHEEELRTYLARQHPGLLARATIEGSGDGRGGVEASLGGRQLLDNTLPSRLQNAWQLLEAEIAAMLFGDGRAQP